MSEDIVNLLHSVQQQKQAHLDQRRRILLDAAPREAADLYQIPDLWVNDSLVDAFFAAVEQSFMGGVRSYMDRMAMPHVDGYDPAYDLQLEGDNQRFLSQVLTSDSPQETAYIIEREKANEENKRILDRSRGLAPAVGEMVGGAIGNPATTLMPAAPLNLIVKGSRISIPRILGWNAGISTSELFGRVALVQNLDEELAFADALAAFVGSSVFGALLAPHALKKHLRTSSGESTIDEVFEEAVTGGHPGAHSSENKNFAEDLTEEEARRSSVGSAEAPGASERLRMTDEDVRNLSPTGIGLEKLPVNPAIRLSGNRFSEAQDVAIGLVDNGGVLREGHKQGITFGRSVETEFGINYLQPMARALRAVRDQYAEFRQIRKSGDGDFMRDARIIATRAKDMFHGTAVLSQQEFRDRVGKALRRDGRDPVVDDASPFVESAASEIRQVFDLIGKNADEVDLFGQAAKKRIETLQSQLNHAKKAAEPSKVERLQAQLKATEEYYIELRKFGPMINTAESYFPRIWRVDVLEERAEDFLAIARKWFTNSGMDPVEASKAARNIYAELIRLKPHPDAGDINDILKEAGPANPRTFNIPDRLVEEFLENDAEAVMRYYTRTMGMDIEIARKFGDITMKDTIDKVDLRYSSLRQERLDKGADASEIRALDREHADTLSDIRSLRDRVRGTYGAPKDPHKLISRAVRGMKNYNVPLYMGGATISSFVDVARVVMTEGMQATLGATMSTLRSASRKHLIEMNRQELNMAGEGLDMLLSMRAAQMADLADPFASRTMMERKFGQLSSAFFIMNGLNMWNNFMKEWAGLVITQRMVSGIEALARGAADEATIARLASNDINDAMARRIVKQIDRFGETIDGMRMPNTAMWRDDEAMMAFRGALRDQVNRTIVTPGAGDRALWTSTEFGSLLTQFKSFGQSAVVRVLMSGLQEGGVQFYQGAAMMVGAGMLVNEIKAAQFDKDTSDMTIYDYILGGVDRSGVLGWFMDANNAALTMSDGAIGFGDDAPSSAGQKFGTVFGPSGSTAMNAIDFTSGLAQGELRDGSARRLIPGNQLPYTSPVFDALERSREERMEARKQAQN